MNMVEEQVMVTLGFNKENPRNSTAPFNQQSQGQPTKVEPPLRPRGSNQILMVVPHPIQWNKGEKTNVGGAVDFLRIKTILIHFKP